MSDTVTVPRDFFCSCEDPYKTIDIHGNRSKCLLCHRPLPIAAAVRDWLAFHDAPRQTPDE